MATPSSKMAAPREASPCGRCGAAAPPYTCPRCNRRLCSLRCYRGHGDCAEAFYRRQVLQALRAEPPARPPAAATLRRLRELREAEAAGGGGGGSSNDLWDALDPAERAEFLRLLSSGEAAELLPPWRPWWWRRPVEELGEEEEGEEEGEGAWAAPAPPVPASIPPLSSFPGPPPSPLLRFQLPNVLYGYAFALSLHAGDEALLPELPAAAVAVSAALRGRRPFSSVAEALGAARAEAAAAGYPPCPLGEAGTVLAVAELLEGRGGADPARDVAAALGHLERLLRGGGRQHRELFGRARRKSRFLLAWCREAAAAPAMAAMAAEARRVRDVIAAEERRVCDVIPARGGPPPERQLVNEGRRLIEELD